MSVLMPARNGVRFLEAALRSVQAQTYQHWELICIDDASEDATAAVVAGLAASDKRIRLLRNTTRMGPGGALNRGLAAASGDFVAIHDCDDVSVPTRLEFSLRAFAADPGLSVVGSGAALINDQGEVIWGRACGLAKAPLRQTLARQSLPLVHSSTMIRTEALRGIGGYDPFFPVSCDYDLFVRLAAARARFGYLQTPLVHHRVHCAQLTYARRHDQVIYSALAWERAQADGNGGEFDLQTALERLSSDPQLQRRARSKVVAYHCTRGLLYLGAGQRQEAGAAFDAALDVEPRSLTAHVACASLLLPPHVVRSCMRSVQSLRRQTWRLRGGLGGVASSRAKGVTCGECSTSSEMAGYTP